MNTTSATDEKRKPRVMVVDDNTEVAGSIRDYLMLEHFDVTVCPEAPQALQELKRQRYDVVLLDLRMPKMSGEEMLSRMREFGWDIPVIILTAHPSIQSAIDTLKLQAFDYIEKPFKMSNVVESINAAIEERGIIAHPKKTLTVELGKRMRELRHEKKITLRQLATRVGVSPSLISKIELGASSPSLYTIYRIIKCLDTDLKGFFQKIEM